MAVGGYPALANRWMRTAARAPSARCFSSTRGPERLPSEYLAHLKTHGWACLAAILPPDITDSLQRIACTDGYSAADA